MAIIFGMLCSMLLASIMLTMTITIKRQSNMLENNSMLGKCESYIAGEESAENISGITIVTSSTLVEDFAVQEVDICKNGRTVFKLWRAR